MKFIFLFLAMLSSCASFEREKYFKADINDDQLRKPVRFVDSTINVSEGIGLEVDNSALTTYLAGIFIPVLPVYFFPDMRRDIKSGEQLTLTYFNTQKSYDRESFKKIKIDPPEIRLWDGRILKAERSDFNDGYTIHFYYPIKALEVKRLTVLTTTIYPPNGQTIITTPTKFKFRNIFTYRFQ